MNALALVILLSWFAAFQTQLADIWRQVSTEPRHFEVEDAKPSERQVRAIQKALKRRERIDVEPCTEEEPNWVEHVWFKPLRISAKEKAWLVEAGAGCARGGQGANGAMWIARVTGDKVTFLATPKGSFSGWMYSVQPTLSHGLYDLVVGWHMSATQANLAYFRFNGRSYRLIGAAVLHSPEDGPAKIVPIPDPPREPR